jgi:ComF family protein
MRKLFSQFITQPLTLALRSQTQCLVCQSEGAALFCAPCVAQAIEPAARCQRCALPLPTLVATHSPVCGACRSHAPPLAACAAAVTYAAPWSEAISAFKFNNQVGMARHLAQTMWYSAAIKTLLQNCDLLLPMPLTRERLAQRGYNQALELAKHLAARAQKPLDSASLLRLHERAPQHGLTRAERLANVRGVFVPAPERVNQIAGKQLCLVDDVMTSGASLYAAAQSLLQVGAASVSAVVLSRTAAPDA